MTTPIRILDMSFTVQGEIDVYTSLIFTRRWHSPGRFELRINRHAPYAGELTRGRIIIIGDDPLKTGIILHREIELGEAGKERENWLVRGASLGGILDRRITIPPALSAYDTITDEAETVMKHYVNANAVNPTDSDREIPGLVLAADQDRGVSMRWQSRYKALHEELDKISVASGLGWEIYPNFDTGDLVFEVYEGLDLTAGNGVNPPVIFSPDYDALRSMGYTESELDYKNVGYTAGQGEGDAREIAEVGSGIGLERRELFIDARDIEDSLDLPGRGEQRLAEFSQETYLDGQILTYSPFRYQEDFDLGDLVTLQNLDWGVTLNARITEITEIYDRQGLSLDAVFGEKVPTLIDKIKDGFEQTKNEVTR